MKYNVTRSTVIQADMDKVQSLVKDFSHWSSWSPWTIAEPDCKVTVKGGVGQVGHEMAWEGEIIGSGMNTVESISEHKIDYDLQFIKPFKSKAKTAFEFRQKEDGVEVVWTMDSSMPFFLFFMVPMMKAWIGMDYDRGLRMLKEMAEKGKVDAKTTNEGLTELPTFSYVGLQRTCTMDEISTAMKEDFGRLMKDLEAQGKTAKHWVSFYPKMDMKNQTMTYIAAMSDEHLKDVDLGTDYIRGEVKPGKALEIKHEGSYEFLGNAWSMGMMYTRAKKLKKSGVPFEYYWNNPKEVQPEALKTSIYFPVKG